MIINLQCCLCLMTTNKIQLPIIAVVKIVTTTDIPITIWFSVSSQKKIQHKKHDFFPFAVEAIIPYVLMNFNCQWIFPWTHSSRQYLIIVIFVGNGQINGQIFNCAIYVITIKMPSHSAAVVSYTVLRLGKLYSQWPEPYSALVF